MNFNSLDKIREAEENRPLNILFLNLGDSSFSSYDYSIFSDIKEYGNLYVVCNSSLEMRIIKRKIKF